MANELTESTDGATAGRRAVVAARRVHFARRPVRVGPAATPGHGPKRVSLIRDRDVITAVEVICSCGERIVLECDYE